MDEFCGTHNVDWDFFPDTNQPKFRNDWWVVYALVAALSFLVIVLAR